MSEKDKYTKSTDKRFTLRMDDELFEFVKESAKKNRRSIAKEIEYALIQFFETEGFPKPTKDSDVQYDSTKQKE